jgi:hypothetical protein
LKASKTALKQQLEQEKRQFRDLAEEKASLESEDVAVNSGLGEFRFDLKRAQTIEVVPIEAFCGAAFDGEVALVIQKIAYRLSLPPGSKIHRTFRAIAACDNGRLKD